MDAKAQMQNQKEQSGNSQDNFNDNVARSKKSFHDSMQAIKRAIKDIKNFLIKALSYIETPINAVASIVDTMVFLIIRIFSNYDELENDCTLTADLLKEIAEKKVNDQGIVRDQIHSIMSIPLTVIIMYNWLYLSCFKQRLIIYDTVEEGIKSISGAISAGANSITGALKSAVMETAGKAMTAASSVTSSMDTIADQMAESAGSSGAAENTLNTIRDSSSGTTTAEGAVPVEGDAAAPAAEGAAPAGEASAPAAAEAPVTVQGSVSIAPSAETTGGDGEAAAAPAAPAADAAPAAPAADAPAAPAADAPAAPAADAPAAPAADAPATADTSGDGADDDEEEEGEGGKEKSAADQLKEGYANMMQGDPLSGWKVYAPILHMIAPVSIFDKWLFGVLYLINTYVISPNLHPLLYYLLFFKVFFNYVRDHREFIGNAVSSAIDYVFANEGEHPSVPIPGFIKQWSSLFVTWSFASSIPEGIVNMSKEFWIVSIIKAILFLISYIVIMVYIDQVCVYVVLYFIFYSFFGIIMFSKVGLYKTMHGIDMYFYKRITGLQNRGDHILNLCINTVFLFIFEIIVLIYLVKGIADYITNIDAIELKITMTLLNIMVIYLLMKYCSYKFHTVWPLYKNDVTDAKYNLIRKDYFDEVIPIESYSDGANTYNYAEAQNALNEKKYDDIDWSDWSKVMSNAGKSVYNTAVSNPLTQAMGTNILNAKDDLTRKLYTEPGQQLSALKEGMSNADLTKVATGFSGNSSATGSSGAQEPVMNTIRDSSAPEAAPAPAPTTEAATAPPPPAPAT